MFKLNAQGHQYGFDSPHFLRYRNPQDGEILFPYKKGLRLKVSSWTGEIRIKFGSETASLSPLTRDQLHEFLLEFFRQWKKEDPESAAKAAFDYTDAQSGFVPLAFVACVLVSLPVAVAMLADSHQQFRCTRILQANAVPGAIDVVKSTKKDSRTFKVKLAFVAPNGESIKAEDLVRTSDEKDIPKTLPIVYSPEEPTCWSLTQGPESNEVNWAKRRYFSYFSLLAGLFFFATGLLGMAWCFARWVRPRPFAQEIASLL